MQTQHHLIILPKHDTQWMVSVALMAAIVILLANTPLGMIQLPIIKATTVHIPVIIGAILLGPSAGAILGFVFGVCSLVSNTMAPTLLSFAFSLFNYLLVIIPAMQDTIQLPSNYNICSTIDTSIKLSTFLFKKNLYIIVGNTGRQCLNDRINIIRRLLFSNPLNCTGKHITI